MTWQIYLIISILTFSFGIIFQRSLLKSDKSDPIAYSIVFQLLSGILIGVYAFSKGFVMPDISHYSINLIIMVVFYSLANIFAFKSLKLIEASNYTILITTRTFWIILGAVLLLKESFSLTHGLGTILIIISVVLVSIKSRDFKFQKGEIYALTAAFFYGSAFVNDAIILKGTDAPSYLFIAFILPALTMWFFYTKSTHKMKALLEKNNLRKIIIFSLFYSISAITMYLSYQVGNNAAQIAPLSQISTILIVLIAIIFLKENDSILRKIIGAILSFIGVILLK